MNAEGKNEPPREDGPAGCLRHPTDPDPHDERGAAWATRKIGAGRWFSSVRTRKCTVVAASVDLNTLEWITGGLVALGAGAIGWVARSNGRAIDELWRARNETHTEVTNVRVLVASQPTRAEFQAMEQRLMAAITGRRQTGH